MKLSDFMAHLPEHEQREIEKRTRELIEEDCTIRELSNLPNRTPEQEHRLRSLLQGGRR